MPKAEMQKFINSMTWIFAKTMADIPHEYIVVGHYPEKSKEIKSFIDEINKNGYTKSFFGKEYKYLEIDNVILSGNEGSHRYKYWVIEDIINRAKI